MYLLVLEIPGLPKTTNAHRGAGHWARYKEDKQWKALVGKLLANKEKPQSPLKKYQIWIERHSSAEPDFDGVISSAKVLIDALREFNILKDDKISNTGTWYAAWVKAKRGQGKMVITIKEAE